MKASLLIPKLRISLSRSTAELLITACAAFVFVQFYQSLSFIVSIGVIGVVFSIPILLKKLEYAIFLLVLVLPFRDFSIISIIHMKRAIIWGLLFYLIIRQFMTSRHRFSRNMILFTKGFALFTVAIIVALLQTASELYTTQYLTAYTLKSAIFSEALTIIEGILIVYIMYYSLETLQQIKKLLSIMIAVSMLISLLGIVQYHLGGVPACLDFLYYRYIPMYGRAMSVFSNPNHLGGFLAPMVVIIVAFLFSESTKQWWRSSFLLCALILDSWALIISFSRGAMVQTFLAIVVMGVFYYAKVSEKRVSWKVGVLAILILTIVFIGIQYYSVYMRARLSMYDNWGDYQAALRWIETTNDFYRKTAAIKAFQTFLKHPLIGLGYGLFPGKGIAGFEFFGLAVHNQVLKILVEMGLLGFIPFVILLGSITKTGLTICKKNQEKPVGQEVKIIVGFLLSGMSAIVFGYLFSDTLSMLAITGYFWIFSGAIFVLERRYVQNIDKFPAIQQANETLDKL